MGGFLLSQGSGEFRGVLKMRLLENSHKTFWAWITRMDTDKHRFFEGFSVRIREICGIRIQNHGSFERAQEVLPRFRDLRGLQDLGGLRVCWDTQILESIRYNRLL